MGRERTVGLMLFSLDLTRAKSCYLWNEGSETAAVDTLDPLAGPVQDLLAIGEWLYIHSGDSLWAARSDLTGELVLLAQGPGSELWPGPDSVCFVAGGQATVLNPERGTITQMTVPADHQVLGAVDEGLVVVEGTGKWGYLNSHGELSIQGLGAVVGVSDNIVFWVDPREPHILHTTSHGQTRSHHHEAITSYKVAWGDSYNGKWVGTYHSGIVTGVVLASEAGAVTLTATDRFTDPFFLGDGEVGVIAINDDELRIHNLTSGGDWHVDNLTARRCPTDARTISVTLPTEQPEDIGTQPSGALLTPAYRSSQLPVGASKIGGAPDLSQPWPEDHDGDRLRFVLQINLADAAMFGGPDPNQLGGHLLSVFANGNYGSWGYDTRDAGLSAVVVSSGTLSRQGEETGAWALAYGTYHNPKSPLVARTENNWDWPTTQAYADTLPDVSPPLSQVWLGENPGHWNDADEALAAAALAQGGVSATAVGDALLNIRHPQLRAMWTLGSDLRVMLAAVLPAGTLGGGARTIYLVGREGSDPTSWRAILGA